MLRPQPARRGFVHAAGSRSDEGAQEARVAAQSQVYRTRTLERLDALDKRMEADFQARLAATQTGPYTAEDRAKDDAYVQFKNQLKGAKQEVAQTGGFGDAGFIDRFFSDLIETAIYTPAGVYELGKAVGFDVRDAVVKGDITPERSAELGKQIAVQTAEDIRHPLRHPGFTALDVFALGTAGYGAGSRVAAAGRAAGAASRAGAGPVGAARSALTRAPSEGGSLLRRPLPGRIELAEGVAMPASANPLVARVQRRRVAEQQKAPERIFAAHLPGRRLPSRIGTQRSTAERIIGETEQAAAAGLAKVGTKSSDVVNRAVQVVGEGVPIRERIAGHQRDLDKITEDSPRTRGQRERLEDEIALLGAVERSGLVDEVGGVPRATAKLAAVPADGAGGWPARVGAGGAWPHGRGGVGGAACGSGEGVPRGGCGSTADGG